MKRKKARTERPPGTRSDSVLTLWVTAGLFVLITAVFCPLIQANFVNYDDDIYVTANYPVQGGLGLKQLAWAFSNTAGGNWHPLTWISHMLDCRLYGTKPWGHHLTSVLLHALNAALLFRVMRALTGTIWRSAAVALLFGLHPLRVESVAWISERKDVLCGTFWLLTMWAYARYAWEFKVSGSSAFAKASAAVKSTMADETADGRFKAHITRSAFLGFFICALMSKPMAVTLPFVLLLMDWWPLQRIADCGSAAAEAMADKLRRAELKKPEAAANSPIKLSHAFAEKWPFFLLSAAMCVVTYLAQKGQGAVVEFLPLGLRIENALIGYCRYLAKFFYPAKLAVLYPYPAAAWPAGEAIAAGVLLMAISALFVRWRGKRPYGLAGWLWFLGTLMPVIGLVQVGSQSIADRYTYLPAIGLNIVVVWGLWELAQRWRMEKFAVAAGTLAGISCALATERQITFWRDGGKLFSHAVAVTENSFQARKALGDYYWSQGNASNAINLYRQAIEMHPKFEGAHLNLGAVFSQTGRSREAEEEFRRATVLDPRDASAFNDLATVVAATNLDEALGLFKQATELDPNYADAHKNLGLALDTKGRREEAMTEYRHVTELRPDAQAHYLLGMDLGRSGRMEEAVRELKETLRLQPDHELARQMLERLKIKN